jgi:peptidyl-prolyl cis-trans isomerase D
MRRIYPLMARVLVLPEYQRTLSDMLAFFRSGLRSWWLLALLGLIMVAFVVTGIGTPSSLSGIGGSGSGTLASVGGEDISQSDVEKRLKNILEAEKEKQPGTDMAALLRLGVAEQVVDELADQIAMVMFGEDNGVVISRKLEDGEISSNPAFFNAAGKFDADKFRSLLSQRNVPEDLYRADLRRSIAVRHLLAPVAGNPTVPMGMALPYASMKLERRIGNVVAIPASAFLSGAVPTPAELTAYYNANKGRYVVPETRAIRYAVFDRASFEGKVVPTDAEIAQYYKNNAARYAASETRGLTQVIVQDQATAQKIAAAGGASLSVAAKGAGVEALAIAPLDEKAFAAQSSTAVARAVFSGTQGSIPAPLKSGLGWHVVKIDQIIKKGGKTVADARAEIIPELMKLKTDEAMQDFVDGLDDASEEGATFDQIVQKNALTAVTTPQITAGGIAPDQPTFKVDVSATPLLKDAFLAELDDKPTTVTLGKDKFALFDLINIAPSAPRPLAKIGEQVKADVIADRASKLARKLAETMMGKLNSGAPLASVTASAGVRLGATQTLNATRLEVIQAGDKVPPPVALMFSMAAGKAKLLEMPAKQGWFLVRVDQIQPGDSGKDPALVQATSGELRELMGREYAMQFTNAVKAQIKVEKNKAAIEAMKRGLNGSGSGTQRQ